MEYSNNGYTGTINGSKTIVHSPDGHVVYHNSTQIQTIEGLQMLVDYIVEKMEG